MRKNVQSLVLESLGVEPVEAVSGVTAADIEAQQAISESEQATEVATEAIDQLFAMSSALEDLQEALGGTETEDLSEANQAVVAAASAAAVGVEGLDVSMEAGIVETAGKVLKAIWEAIKKFAARVKKFFTDGVAKLLGDRLKKKLDEVSDIDVAAATEAAKAQGTASTESYISLENRDEEGVRFVSSMAGGYLMLGARKSGDDIVVPWSAFEKAMSQKVPDIGKILDDTASAVMNIGKAVNHLLNVVINKRTDEEAEAIKHLYEHFQHSPEEFAKVEEEVAAVFKPGMVLVELSWRDGSAAKVASWYKSHGKAVTKELAKWEDLLRHQIEVAEASAKYIAQSQKVHDISNEAVRALRYSSRVTTFLLRYLRRLIIATNSDNYALMNWLAKTSKKKSR